MCRGGHTGQQAGLARAFDCVSPAAVSRLGAVVGSALAHCPAPLLGRMRGAGAAFAVFGAEQVVSDVPAHRFMRHNTGRDLDASARGLGGTPALPLTSCGEENITMSGDRWYPCQSILVHELGHAVLNLGLRAEQVAQVLAAFRQAQQERLYPADCYMMTNEQEYWAVAVESWFESTVREDINGGIRTRAALRAHDPRLARLLEEAFGDGSWRYWHDCPRPLAMPTHGSAAGATASAEQATASSSHQLDSQHQRRPLLLLPPSPTCPSPSSPSSPAGHASGALLAACWGCCFPRGGGASAALFPPALPNMELPHTSCDSCCGSCGGGGAVFTRRSALRAALSGMRDVLFGCCLAGRGKGRVAGCGLMPRAPPPWAAEDGCEGCGCCRWGWPGLRGRRGLGCCE
ncbi:hypothetical protein Agub_g13394, partial [Astrephomene gubernaculifera]